MADFVQSINSAVYPAVCFKLGNDLRLVVNGKGTRYQLQRLSVSPEGEMWFGKTFHATRAALLNSYCGKVKGFRKAVKAAGLPERPAGLFPDFEAERLRQSAAFDATNTELDAYSRVAAICDDWRLIVYPDGSTYCLQFVRVGCWSCHAPEKGNDMWVYSIAHPDLAMIVAAILRRGDARFGWKAAFWGSDPEKLLPALRKLPASACFGSWPDLPERPISVALQFCASAGASQG